MAVALVTCSWCQKVVGKKECVGSDGPTHTICDECVADCYPDAEEEKAIIAFAMANG